MDDGNRISAVAGHTAAVNHGGNGGIRVAGGGMSTPAQISGFGAVTNRAIAAVAMAGGGAD